MTRDDIHRRELGRDASAGPTADRFAHFDGAYVLGALTDADRVAFEQHLKTCRSCAAEVESLRSVTALLASASPAAFDPESSHDLPAPELLPALLRSLRAQRRRRRVTLAAVAGLAAACLILVSALIIRSNRPTTAATGHAVAMTAVVSTPIHASATLTRVSWGTLISLRCSYAAGSRYPAGATYRLVVTDSHGAHHSLGDWQVVPGTITTYQSGTSLTPADIASVTITTDTGLTVLRLQR